MMVFRTSVKLTVLLLALAVVFGRLGYWQLQRMGEKEALFDRFDNAPMMSVANAILREERFARVQATGRYDPRRHILLDNKLLEGRAGVHVLTPFTTADGVTILVNRGWLPMPPDRRSLPEVSTNDALLTISGRLNHLESTGPRLGEKQVLEPDTWPQLLTYLDREPVERVLGQSLPPWLVQLDPDDNSGFAGRQWRAAVMTPAVHVAYAVQWFGLMVAAIVIWLVLGFRPSGAPQKDKQEHRT